MRMVISIEDNPARRFTVWDGKVKKKVGGSNMVDLVLFGYWVNKKDGLYFRQHPHSRWNYLTLARDHFLCQQRVPP